MDQSGLMDKEASERFLPKMAAFDDLIAGKRES